MKAIKVTFSEKDAELYAAAVKYAKFDGRTLSGFARMCIKVYLGTMGVYNDKTDD